MRLDYVELILEVEDSFEIEIPDKDAQNLTTPRMLGDYIFAALQSVKLNPNVTREDVRIRLREIILRQLGIDHFDEDAHFERDLFKN